MGLGITRYNTVILIVLRHQLMPYFFRDERHEWMQHGTDLPEITDRPVIRFSVNRLTIVRLDHFEIPRAEITSDQCIQAHQSIGQPVLRKLILQACDLR